MLVITIKWINSIKKNSVVKYLKLNSWNEKWTFEHNLNCAQIQQLGKRWKIDHSLADHTRYWRPQSGSFFDSGSAYCPRLLLLALLIKSVTSKSWANNVTKCKGSPYSITERRVPELIPVLGSQPAGDRVTNPAVGCHYFPPGLQLPPQPLRGFIPISLLVEQRKDGWEQFAFA